MQRYFRDVAWMVRPPRRLQELQRLINRASNDLTIVLGREPTSDDLVAALDITAEELSHAAQSFGCLQPLSLDQTMRSTLDLTMGDIVPEELFDRANALDRVDARLMLESLRAGLGARDRFIVQRRYYDGCSQCEIGDELRVTQAQVPRLINRILHTLHNQLQASTEDKAALLARCA